jgi:hypothetical protein
MAAAKTAGKVRLVAALSSATTAAYAELNQVWVAQTTTPVPGGLALAKLRRARLMSAHALWIAAQ